MVIMNQKITIMMEEIDQYQRKNLFNHTLTLPWNTILQMIAAEEYPHRF